MTAKVASYAVYRNDGFDRAKTWPIPHPENPAILSTAPLCGVTRKSRGATAGLSSSEKPMTTHCWASQQWHPAHHLRVDGALVFPVVEVARVPRVVNNSAPTTAPNLPGFPKSPSDTDRPFA